MRTYRQRGRPVSRLTRADAKKKNISILLGAIFVKKIYPPVFIVLIFFLVSGAACAHEILPGGRAEKMMRALAEAYPEKIERVEYRDGDWAVLMEGKWYFYSDNRLLPEELLPMKENYSPQSFYEYFTQLPEWRAHEGEAAERMKNILQERRRNPPRRDSSFFDTIWNARNSNEAYGNLVKINFLGKSLNVHKDLAERFAKVEARINEAAKNDPALRYWINNIGSVSAWNWRNVAATVSRSFHAYAVAVDILPKNHRNLHTYWLWSADTTKEWYNIPYSQRWHPPDAVIMAFEAYGFCWGGKWQLFDTMHFEYRPEIMLMSGIAFEMGGDAEALLISVEAGATINFPDFTEEWEAFLKRINKEDD